MNRPTLALLQSMIAAARFCAAAVMPFLLLACKDAAAPPGPPYLAIVSTLYSVGGASAPDSLTYGVRDLANARISRRFKVAPADTVLVPVPPANYAIDVLGLPARCIVANGASRTISLSDADNTGIIRYSIQCRGVVSVAVIADGAALDSTFVYRLRNDAGAEYSGLIAANDTIALDDVREGSYEVRLGGIAENCVILSDGGATQRVSTGTTGGATVSFRLTCSDWSARPRLLSLVSGFDLGTSIFSFRVYDPEHDVDGYTWDLTDCEGNSVLPDRRERTRRGLLSGRGQLSDTLTVVGAYQIAISAAEAAGRCTEIRVFDQRGNVSDIRTHRIGSATGFRPSVRFFNATLQGTASVTSLLAASDPENDIIGHFVLVRLRDGVLGPSDGKADLGSMDPAGYLGLEVPAIPTTGNIKWDDVLAVMVYIIDAKGNVIGVEDADILK